MTFSELKSARASAGARYAVAVAELRDAYIELAALDFAWIAQNGGRQDFAPTFFHLPQNAEHFAHPEFAPTDASKCWREEVKARRDVLLKSLGN